MGGMSGISVRQCKRLKTCQRLVRRESGNDIRVLFAGGRRGTRVVANGALPPRDLDSSDPVLLGLTSTHGEDAVRLSIVKAALHGNPILLVVASAASYLPDQAVSSTCGAMGTNA